MGAADRSEPGVGSSPGAKSESAQAKERYYTRGRLSRGRGLRKTTGCFNCRRRHVKCDEEKPVCRGCSKAGQACEYPPQGHTTRRGMRSSTAVKQSSTSIEDDSERRNANRGENREGNNENIDPGLQRGPSGKDEDGGSDDDDEYHHEQLDDGQAPQPPTGDSGTAPWVQTPDAEHHLSFQPPTSVPTPVFIPNGDDEMLLRNLGIHQQPNGQGQDTHDTAAHLGTRAHDGGPGSTTSSTANIENATAVWVDLLLKDAAAHNFDIGSFGLEPSVPNLLSSPPVASSPAISAPTPDGGALQHGHQSGLAFGASPTTVNPYLRERVPALSRHQRFEKQAWQTETPLRISPHEHLIFQNFVRNTSLWMDLFDSKRPFATHVPHLARHNVGLMNAVLAVSVRHLTLTTIAAGARPSHDPNDALRYYYKTLHYIQEAMHFDTYKTSLELLATSSIVSAYEMLDGCGQDWGRHLKGVFWIQRSQVIHGDSTGLQQAVWWAWLCQDIWAAFRENRRPYTFWRPVKTLDELDPYELAARSSYFFAQVVGFCSNEEAEQGQKDPLGRMSRAEELWSVLEDWKRHTTAEFEPLPWPSSSEDVFQPIWVNPPAFGVALQLYYCSHILLLLNRPQLGGLGVYAQQRASLMEYVGKVCGIAMTLTDYPSSVLCSQCLFIAGLALEDSQQRRCVLGLLESCRKRSGWPVKSLGEELSVRWGSFGKG